MDESQVHEYSGVSGCHVIETIMGIFESAAYSTHVRSSIREVIIEAQLPLF